MRISGHDAWVTANKNVPTNLSNEGGVNNGVLVDSAIQEYDLRTGKLVYTWKASDHIPLSQSKTQPPTNGFGYDAYHVNAVQLLSGGRMLVSMRNTSAVYMIDIKSGKILWTLGGKDSSFTVPSDAHFEWQHDAQMVNGNTLTMFDDHCCYITGAGVYLSATGPSRGLELRLNFQNHTVTRLAQYYLFGTTVHSEYMGNMQILPNGERFIGWGQAPFFSCTRRPASWCSTRRCHPRTCPTGPMSRPGSAHRRIRLRELRRRAPGTRPSTRAGTARPR